MQVAMVLPPDVMASKAPFSWRTRVHALNTLRGIFKNGTLSGDTGVFVPSALRVALGGFSSPSWAIRNSSLMLYAAVLERAVGSSNRNSGASAEDKRGGGGGASVGEVNGEGEGAPGAAAARAAPTAGGGGGGGGVSTSAFFTRFPSLRALLLTELAGAPRVSADTSGQHPSLYPVMLLLSRLRPEAGMAAAAAATDGEEDGAGRGDGGEDAVATPASTSSVQYGGLAVVLPFIPLLLRAGEQPNALVRAMSARALHALLPMPLRLAMLPLFMERLGIHAAQREAGRDAVSSAEQTSTAFARRSGPVPWNTVHGTLLQLRSLLPLCRVLCAGDVTTAVSSTSTAAIAAIMKAGGGAPPQLAPPASTTSTLREAVWALQGYFAMLVQQPRLAAVGAATSDFTCSSSSHSAPAAPAIVRAAALDVCELLDAVASRLAWACGAPGESALHPSPARSPYALSCEVLGVGAFARTSSISSNSVGAFLPPPRADETASSSSFDVGVDLLLGVAARGVARAAMSACMGQALVVGRQQPRGESDGSGTPVLPRRQPTPAPPLLLLHQLLCHERSDVRVSAAKCVKSALKHAVATAHSSAPCSPAPTTRDGVLALVNDSAPQLSLLLLQRAVVETNPDAQRYAAHGSALLVLAMPPAAILSLMMRDGEGGGGEGYGVAQGVEACAGGSSSSGITSGEGGSSLLLRALHSARDASTRAMLVRMLGAVAQCAMERLSARVVPASVVLAGGATTERLHVVGDDAGAEGLRQRRVLMHILHEWRGAATICTLSAYTFRLRLAAAASVRRSGLLGTYLQLQLPQQPRQQTSSRLVSGPSTTASSGSVAGPSTEGGARTTATVVSTAPSVPAPASATTALAVASPEAAARLAGELGAWAWGCAIAALVDGDDEVREQGRAAVTDAFIAVQPLLLPLLRQPCSSEPRSSTGGDTSPLQNPLEVWEAATASTSAGSLRHPLPAVDLASLITPLLSHPSSSSSAPPLSVCDHSALQLAMFLLSCPSLSCSRSSPTRALLRRIAAGGAAVEAVDSPPLTQVAEQGCESTAAGGSSSLLGGQHGGLPRMLTRPMFAPDPPNEFMEPLELRAWAAAAVAVIDSTSTVRAEGGNAVSDLGGGNCRASPTAPTSGGGSSDSIALSGEIGPEEAWIGGPWYAASRYVSLWSDAHLPAPASNCN